MMNAIQQRLNDVLHEKFVELRKAASRADTNIRLAN